MSEEAKNTVPGTEQPETAPEEKAQQAAPEQEPAAEAAAEEDKKKDGGWFNKKAREMEAVKAKLDAAEKNAAQAKDQLLRMAAEYDNYRKRSTREADQKFGDGVSHAVEKIIPILDTLDMTATQLLVVPRSIPIILLIMKSPLERTNLVYMMLMMMSSGCYCKLPCGRFGLFIRPPQRLHGG